MQKLALVIDVVDMASEAAERDEPLDAKQEARRLVADRPAASSSPAGIRQPLAPVATLPTTRSVLR